MDLKKYRVPRTAITERGLKKLLRKRAKKHPSVSDWATSNGLTAQSVSAFMRDVQTAGLLIPEKLGYIPQIVYLPVDEDPIYTPKAPRSANAKHTSKVDSKRDPVEKKGFVKNDREETKKKLRARKVT